jgi:hypothetical protein
MQGVVFLLQDVHVVLDVRKQYVHVLGAVGIHFGARNVDAFPIVEQREALQAHARKPPLHSGVGSFVVAFFDLFLHLE